MTEDHELTHLSTVCLMLSQLSCPQGKVFVASMGEHALKAGPQETTLQLYQVRAFLE